MKLLPLQTKMLSCRLTNDEVREYGQKLAVILEDIANEVARQASFKQEMKAAVTGLESQAAALGSKIRRREELRDVEVQPELDFEAGVYRESRIDTGSVIKERPITAEERQEFLPLVDGDASSGDDEPE